eukprot:jgi/Chrzof1/5880/Cz16g19060.t1
MGKLDPAAYDRWWRNRIEKEEGDYVRHITDVPTFPSVTLNTIGAPQLTRTTQAYHAAATAAPGGAHHHHHSHSYAHIWQPSDHKTSQAGREPASTRAITKVACCFSGMGLPLSASLVSAVSYSYQPATARSMQDGDVFSAVSGSCLSQPTPKSSCKSPRHAAAAAAGHNGCKQSPRTAGKLQVKQFAQSPRSSLSGYHTPQSCLSYPKTPDFSNVGSSADSQIMGRLAKLESALQEERVKRERAEKEIRQLLSSQGGRADKQP